MLLLYLNWGDVDLLIRQTLVLSLKNLDVYIIRNRFFKINRSTKANSNLPATITCDIA